MRNFKRHHKKLLTISSTFYEWVLSFIFVFYLNQKQRGLSSYSSFFCSQLSFCETWIDLSFKAKLDSSRFAITFFICLLNALTTLSTHYLFGFEKEKKLSRWFKVHLLGLSTNVNFAYITGNLASNSRAIKFVYHIYSKYDI
jgi:hypothetical protein